MSTNNSLLSQQQQLVSQISEFAKIGTANIASATINGATANPTGSIIMWAGTAAPTGYQLCDGTAISRTTYATLFAVISTTYGAGDTTTTFNVPDMRGFAPVGVGTSSNATDADSIAHVADTWALGQKRNDRFQSHRHNRSSGGASELVLNSGGVFGLTGGVATATYKTTTYEPVVDGFNGTPRIKANTMGKRIAINFCIKL